jgi:Fe-S-cluster containining protein
MFDLDALHEREILMSTATENTPSQRPLTIDGRRPEKSEVPNVADLCEYCTAKCCRYFALPIEEPTEQQDFDFIRWYLLHEHATVFVDEGEWYLLVHTTCKHLQSDFRCGIYHTRPQICRDYSTTNCEYDNDTVYDRYFETPEQMAEYMEAMMVNTSSSTIRSAQPDLLPML